MLQEILMSLAGHPSPLFVRNYDRARADAPNDPFPELSPPERALLSTVAHLGDLHARIKKTAATIASNHGSTICRNVASNILNVQLHDFLTKVVEVEKSILSRDSKLVGGDGIVPLSIVVGEFTPWTRRLEWLWTVIQAINGSSVSSTVCSGPRLINRLREESHTGYQEVRSMIIKLIRVAESTWMQILSTWLLYGRLPSTGSEDFFIEPVDNAFNDGSPVFNVKAGQLPDFVSPQSAASVLFVGESLNNARSHRQAGAAQHSSDPTVPLASQHAELLRKIDFPISSLRLESIVSLIRMSVSQNILSLLLPASQIIDLVLVLQEFLLLRRGTFAQTLITNARKRRTHQRDQKALLPIRKAGRQETVTAEADLVASLNQTWSDLFSLQSGEELMDEVLEKGREWIRLTPVRGDGDVKSPSAQFSSLVFAVPLNFGLELPKNSSLTLFLGPAEVSAYSEVAIYLLAIRRAEDRLASLWQNSSLRRPPFLRLHRPGEVSAGRKRDKQNKRDHERSLGMRRHWATASKCHFMVAELSGYFQGELVAGHSAHFLSWLRSSTGTPASSKLGSRPNTSGGGATEQPKVVHSGRQKSTHLQHVKGITTQKASQTDPTSLALVHKSFIEALQTSLLLKVPEITKVLLRLLMLVDHYVALFGRLDSTWRNLNYELHDDRADPLADHRKEEREVLDELNRSREGVEDQLDALVKQLRNSSVEYETNLVSSQRSASTLSESDYVPWKAPSMDSLLMRLESTGSRLDIGTTDLEEDDD